MQRNCEIHGGIETFTSILQSKRGVSLGWHVSSIYLTGPGEVNYAGAASEKTAIGLLSALINDHDVLGV